MPQTLKSLWTALTDAKAAAAAAQAQAEAATLAKVEALETLIGAMKKEIRYAENQVNFEDDRLKPIGWGVPTPSAPTPEPGKSRRCAGPFETIERPRLFVVSPEIVRFLNAKRTPKASFRHQRKEARLRREPVENWRLVLISRFRFFGKFHTDTAGRNQAARLPFFASGTHGDGRAQIAGSVTQQVDHP